MNIVDQVNFKVSDRVVFINNKLTEYGWFIPDTELTLGKVYIVASSYKQFNIHHIRIINDANFEYGYVSSRFISLADSRRLKLKKLNRL